jgi:hypothetical protein
MVLQQGLRITWRPRRDLNPCYRRERPVQLFGAFLRMPGMPILIWFSRLGCTIGRPCGTLRR